VETMHTRKQAYLVADLVLYQADNALPVVICIQSALLRLLNLEHRQVTYPCHTYKCRLPISTALAHVTPAALTYTAPRDTLPCQQALVLSVVDGTEPQVVMTKRWALLRRTIGQRHSQCLQPARPPERFPHQLVLQQIFLLHPQRDQKISLLLRQVPDSRFLLCRPRPSPLKFHHLVVLSVHASASVPGS
jgi:hypothetical protein